MAISHSQATISGDLSHGNTTSQYRNDSSTSRIYSNRTRNKKYDYFGNKRIEYGKTEYDYTPKLKWYYKTQYRWRAGPAVDSNGNVYMTVYTTDIGGALQAISPQGKLLWEFNNNGEEWQLLTYPLVSSDGVIYVGSYNGLFAINKNGTLKWVK